MGTWNQWALGLFALLGVLLGGAKASASPELPPRFVDKLASLRSAMDREIPGQAWLKDTLVDLATQRAAGLTDPELPAIRLLIPTGTGASALPTLDAFARHFGLPMLAIDLGKLESESELIITLLEAVESNPHSIFALDGLERCKPDVLKLVLKTIATRQMPIRLKGENNSFIEKSIDLRGLTFIAMTDLGASLIDAEANGENSLIGFRQRNQTELSVPMLRAGLLEEGLPSTAVDLFQTIAPALASTREELEILIVGELDAILAELPSKPPRVLGKAAFAKALAERVHGKAEAFGLESDLKHYLSTLVARAKLANAASVRLDVPGFEAVSHCPGKLRSAG